MFKRAANDPLLTTLRAAANGELRRPRTNRRFGDRAVSVAAPKACPEQSTHILTTATCSTDAFKRPLKDLVLQKGLRLTLRLLLLQLSLFYQCFIIIIIIFDVIIIVIIARITI